MIRKASFAIVLVALVAATTGCVYYNTFYHARSAYDEAERIRTTRPPDSNPTSGELDLLDRVVEKSGRVLKLYPESSWADDALLLLAQALYRQEKYESAETRLTSFLTLYPESELRPQAEYALAAVMLARGNPVSAEQAVQTLAYADPPRDLSDDAMVLIGRAKNARRHFDEAAEVYMSALERFPRSDLRAEVHFLAAENYTAMGRLDDAARHLRLVAEESGARQLAFEARIKLADVYLELNELDEALSVLSDLERRTVDRDELDRVLLLRGETLEAGEDYDESVETYGGIAASHARSEAAAEARYRIGLIRRDRFGLFDEAIEAFRAARDESPRSDVAKLATKAMKDVENLQGYLLTIKEWSEPQVAEDAPVDTLASVVVDSLAPSETATAETVVPSEMALVDTLVSSEVTLVDTVVSSEAALVETLASSEISLVDTLASSEISLVDTLASSEITLVDTLALSEITLADTLALSEITLADTLPSSEITLDTPGEREEPPAGDDDADDISELALARFRVAELYLFKLDNPELAIDYYTDVVSHHGESELAPKAALAIAYVRESVLGQPVLASGAYRDVMDLYPETEHAIEAEKALAALVEREHILQQ